MKKLLCILLSCILAFNSVFVIHADTSGSFDPYERAKEQHPEWFDANGHVKPAGSELFNHMIVPKLIPGGDSAIDKLAALTGAIGEFLNGFDNSNDDITIEYDNKGEPVTENTYNENNFYFKYSPKFTTQLNQQVQDKVHALDGYYLYEPDYSYTFDNFCYVWNNLMGYKKDIKNYDTETLKSCVSAFNMFSGCFLYKLKNAAYRNYYFLEDVYFYLSGSSVICSDGSSEVSKIHRTDFPYQVFNYSKLDSRYYVSNLHSYLFTFYNKDAANEWCFLSKTPIKIFYSKQDLDNYLNKGRTYAPKLPSGGLKVPITYIQNNVNLPDLNINLDSLIGKAELDIQADIDLALKNYFDSLLEINNNPTQPTKPTPTPDGGFTDGTTPTPTPPITDGGDDSGNGKIDLKEITDLLKQILEKLTFFTDSHTKFEKTITDYIEANDGKLDDIIKAINALAQGKTEEEKNGCKYDFTALSEYLKDLWKDSDKKFDKMISLLEENNEYQQELVDRLDTIKKILVTQTILEVFQNRSRETAEKAKEKFPTSVPWDIAMMVNAMAAEPQAPKFSLPINIGSLNIHEEIDVDLTNEEWEKLAKTCRYMLSLLFILFMVQLSRKLFFSGGDD